MTIKTFEQALHAKLDAQKKKGTREKCGCCLADDIGQYDTCRHLCRYCYANSNAEAVQAEYLRRGLQIFAENPHVLGSFLFCFQDARNCYHCGASDCPSECYWGIVDVEGRPKQAYAAVRQAIRDYYKK